MYILPDFLFLEPSLLCTAAMRLLLVVVLSLTASGVFLSGCVTAGGYFLLLFMLLHIAFSYAFSNNRVHT
jgi:hypothetical protein